jgi:hypothetical protein
VVLLWLLAVSPVVFCSLLEIEIDLYFVLCWRLRSPLDFARGVYPTQGVNDFGGRGVLEKPKPRSFSAMT